MDAQSVPVDDRGRFAVAVEQVERVEVAVHPAHRTALRGPSVGVPLQEGAPLQEPVQGQFVEGVAGAVTAHLGEQAVDEREGVGGVGTPGRIGTLGTLCVGTGGPGRPGALGRCRRSPALRRHHPFQTRVDDAQERPQPRALLRGELTAVPVAGRRSRGAARTHGPR